MSLYEAAERDHFDNEDIIGQEDLDLLDSIEQAYLSKKTETNGLSPAERDIHSAPPPLVLTPELEALRRDKSKVSPTRRVASLGPRRDNLQASEI